MVFALVQMRQNETIKRKLLRRLMQFNEMLLLLQLVLQPKVRNGAKRSCQTGNRRNTFTKFGLCQWEIVAVSCVLRFLRLCAGWLRTS